VKEALLHTPEGVRDIYGEECREKQALIENLTNACRLYGYDSIQTPTMEFFDVFSKERGSVPSNELFKLFDRYGNTIVLRPDMTPSIARSCAKYYSDHILPIKLCYHGDTFINDNKYYQGRLKENTIVGAELIDDSTVEADFEIISMVIECMKSSGLEEFMVEIGSSAYVAGLINAAGLDDDAKEEIVNYMQDKNYTGVEAVLKSLNTDKEISTALASLPQLFGSVEILDRAEKIAENAESQAAIKRLRDLYKLLKITGADKYITFDLGAVSSHAYYTGIMFHAYTYGTGEPVINGGRYDKLVGQFGKDKAAIGFSVNVDRLLIALSRQGINLESEKKGALIVYHNDDQSRTVYVADQLRQQGIPACMITYSDAKNEDQYIEYALNSSLKYLILMPDLEDDFDIEKIGSVKVKLIDACQKTGQETEIEKILKGALR